MKKARIETNKGTLVVELFEADAPLAVENFVGLAGGTKEWTNPKTNQKEKRPFYDGLKFHRVIDNFMIQGGDPWTAFPEEQRRWGTGGPGYKIKCETSDKHKHVRGSLSMAHAGRDTGGSQFFICHSPQPHLNHHIENGRPAGHTVFGQVIEGMDVIDKIRTGDSLVRVTVEG